MAPSCPSAFYDANVTDEYERLLVFSSTGVPSSCLFPGAQNPSYLGHVVYMLWCIGFILYCLSHSVEVKVPQAIVKLLHVQMLRMVCEGLLNLASYLNW